MSQRVDERPATRHGDGGTGAGDPATGGARPSPVAPSPSAPTYEAAGVAPPEGLLAGLLRWVNRTAALRPDVGGPLLPNGYFANVVRLRDDLGLAICTDGVG